MTDEIVLWFNARCSKCRAALQILEGGAVPFRLRHYLDEPPSRAELERAVELLGGDARAIARTGDDAWARLGLDAAGPSDLLAALAEHPALIERPLAFRGDRALVARPPERVRELL